MTTKLAIEIFGYGGLIPAVVAFAVARLAAHLLPESLAERYPAALALGLGFFTGYALLPEQLHAPLLPERYWHWLPWLGVLAMITGPVGRARGLFAIERWLLQALVAAAAAWLLVPDWASLEPSRPVMIGLLAGYLFLLTALLEPLPARVPGRLFGVILWGVAACVAVTVWAEVSETYGRVAAVAASALFGVAVAGFFAPRDTFLQGSIPAFALLVGGAAFAGYVYPQPPLYPVLILPAAPLVLWLTVRGPLSRLQGFKSTALRVFLVLVPVGLAVTLAVL